MDNQISELIFLSQTTAGAGMKVPDINVLPSGTWEVDQVGPARPRNADFFLANVMWIRWVDQPRRIAERVAVSQVHGKAWFGSEP
jgi:hypothetical protein